MDQGLNNSCKGETLLARRRENEKIKKDCFNGKYYN